MKICQLHWDKLRTAIKEKGLDHLGAKTGQDAIRNIVTELEGREAENDYDPLMSCNWMIMNQSLKVYGFAAMDGDKCPVCVAIQAYENDWIYGPVGAAYEEAKNQGLLKQSETEPECSQGE